MKIQPIILGGGSGTRLWPLSRAHYPKQLISIHSEHSLLQDTMLRLDGLDSSQHSADGGVIEVADPIVVCNEEHRFLIAEQVRNLNKSASRIVLEPVGRNTAPALTLGALVAQSDEDSILLVLPADHIIQDNSAFHHAVRNGATLANEGHVVTFGIVPTSAETGYGYIKTEVPLNPLPGYRIEKFVEKPDQKTAQGYVSSGNYLWNSGMFMMKASVWLDAIAHFNEPMATACRGAFEGGQEDHDFYRIDKDRFQNCPSDSIDYAVMEKITGVAQAAGCSVVSGAALVPLDAGWSDVGSWSSLWGVSDKDQDGNFKSGDVYALKTRNSLVLAEHRLVACLGLEDIVVVETPDAVLVANKANVQEIKSIVNDLKSDGRTQHQTHRKVFRPWGAYEGIDNGERFQVKRITVNPGASLSLQMHYHRAEHWIVVRGTAKVIKGDEEILLSEDQSTYIPLGTTHRLENPGKVPLEMIEVQSGSYLGEDDIVRFEDVYGRTGGNRGNK